MARTLALAGDAMLGRGVAAMLRANPAAPLIASEVAAQIERADAFVLNLECCVSDRGSPFPDPAKRFFFRAPPVATERLAAIGVDAVTLANNHMLDYGPVALLDTLAHLEAAGILAVGAGLDEALARAPRVVRCGDVRVRLVGFSDHPAAYAARLEQPGIAFADLTSGLPGWVREAVRPGSDADAVLVMPHWGANMVAKPSARIRRAADELLDAGATLVAGHSAHVFHGVASRLLFDLGDFVDDYRAHPQLRNDLGLLWLVELDHATLGRVRALPLALEYCFTRQASQAEADWIVGRMRELCAPFATVVENATHGLIELHAGSSAQ